MSFEKDLMKIAQNKLPYLVRCYIFIAEHEIDIEWNSPTQNLNLIYLNSNRYSSVECVSYKEQTKSLALQQGLEAIAKQNNWSI